MQTRYTYYPGPKSILGDSAVCQVPCLHRYPVVLNFSTGSNLLAAPLERPKAAALSSGAGGSSGTPMTTWNASSYLCYLPYYLAML